MNIQDIFIAPAEINASVNSFSGSRAAESDSFDDYLADADSSEVRNEPASGDVEVEEANTSNEKPKDASSDSGSGSTAAKEERPDTETSETKLSTKGDKEPSSGDVAVVEADVEVDVKNVQAGVLASELEGKKTAGKFTGSESPLAFKQELLANEESLSSKEGFGEELLSKAEVKDLAKEQKIPKIVIPEDYTAQNEDMPEGAEALIKAVNNNIGKHEVKGGGAEVGKVLQELSDSGQEASGGGNEKGGDSPLNGFGLRKGAAEGSPVNRAGQLNFKLAQQAAVGTGEAEGSMNMSRLAVDASRGDVKMSLNSSTLGRLQVELSMQDNSLKAVFHADSQAVKSALDSNMQDFKDSLAGKDVNLESFDVFADSGNRGQGKESNPDAPSWKTWNKASTGDGLVEIIGQHKTGPLEISSEGLNIFV